jgi:hypothetical protein
MRDQLSIRFRGDSDNSDNSDNEFVPVGFMPELVERAGPSGPEK